MGRAQRDVEVAVFAAGQGRLAQQLAALHLQRRMFEQRQCQPAGLQHFSVPGLAQQVHTTPCSRAALLLRQPQLRSQFTGSLRCQLGLGRVCAGAGLGSRQTCLQLGGRVGRSGHGGECRKPHGRLSAISQRLRSDAAPDRQQSREFRPVAR